MTALVGTSTGGTVLTVLYFLYKTVVGKKCRFRCGSRDIELGMAIDNMTPPETRHAHFEVQNPMKDKDLPISVIVPNA